MSEEKQPPGTAGRGGAAAKGDRWPRWGPDPGSDPGSAQEPGSGEPHRLVRSRQHKVVGGVCAGLGRHFGLDPVLFRVPLGVLSVVSGIGLIFYGFAWLLIPAEDEGENELRRLMSGRVEGSSLAAVLVALVGCGLFLASMDTRSTPFSVLLVGAVVGAAYWSQHRRRSEADAAAGVPADPATAHAVADAPPEAQAPPVPSAPSWWRDPLTKGDGGEPAAGYLWGPDDGTVPDVAYSDEERAARHAWPDRAAGDDGGREERRRRQGRSIGGLVLLLAVLAAAGGVAASWGTESLATSLAVGFSCALAVFGLGLVISAFLGRVGIGTVLALVCTGALLAGTALVPDGIGTDWQSRTWTPASAEQIRPQYRLGTGQAELDLRGLGLKDDETVRTDAGLGAGRLTVVVPRNAAVTVQARADVGDIRVPVRTDRDGLVVFSSSGGVDQRMERTLQPFGGAKARGTVDLRVAVDVGQVEVVRQLPSGERSDGTQRTTPGGAPAPGNPASGAPDAPDAPAHEEAGR